jgi:hypothetical protein
LKTKDVTHAGRIFSGHAILETKNMAGLFASFTNAISRTSSMAIPRASGAVKIGVRRVE